MLCRAYADTFSHMLRDSAALRYVAAAMMLI